MQNKKLSIRKIVTYLNNEEAEGGGFWLPNIQRPFVWSEEQIARLFDSIMREYPISTLLAWKTKELIKHRKFIENYRRDIKLTDFYVPENNRTKLLVLDGQQRLQSLAIGLRGSYDGRELYLDALSGGSGVAPEDIRYRFAFRREPEWPWMRFKDLVFINNKIDSQIAREVAARAPETLADADRELIELNIGRARKEFVNDDTITYQELDGVDNPEAYGVDDVVEIFIRANSGGTKLSKSDLLFSLLTSSWKAADRQLGDLLDDLNQGGFKFDRDFVLKACLSMLGKGARYEVEKFRDGKTKEAIVSQWDELSEAIKAVRDFVVTATYIRSDRAMVSYLALIPLIYLRYRFPKQFAARKADLVTYLLRALIAGVFSGSPDNLIDKLTRNIHDAGDFILSDVYGIIRADGRSLEITPQSILDQHYGSRGIHLIFNLWYRDFDYSPASDANGPQVDHIFAQSLLKAVKSVNPSTGRRDVLRYRSEERDQIANCMLLTAAENGFTAKSATPPNEWFAASRFSSVAEQQKYLKMHLIPNDQALWHLDRYTDFIAARKVLIEQKFAYMLQQVTNPEGELDEHQTLA